MRKITGLIFVFLATATVANSEMLFKHKYMRLGMGSCSKCVFSVKLLNQLKDEFKPVIVFTNNDITTYKSDLIANLLEDWPMDRIIFSDSIAAKFPLKDYATLYLSNDGNHYEEIVLDIHFNINWLNIANLGFSYDETKLNSKILLSNFDQYYSTPNFTVIHNPKAKTISQMSKKKLVVFKLTEDLKLEIISPFLVDTASQSAYKKGARLLKSHGIDGSSFGSISHSADTLVAIVSISYVRFLGNVNKISRSQFLCKFIDGKLVSSNKLKETKEHVTYDEYGSNDLYYKNDSIFLRSNLYDRKDRIKKGNHLTLFTLNGGYYEKNQNYNLEVPDYILNLSTTTFDYTTGSFYQNSDRPDYYFIKQPGLYEAQSNITLPWDRFINNGDTASILSVMKFYDFTLILTGFKDRKTHALYFIYKDKIIKSDIVIDEHYYPIAFTKKGISYVDFQKQVIKELNFELSPLKKGR